jgi:hypothetical protein
MPTTDQQSALAGAIDAIRSAEMLLTAQIRTADDTLLAIKLTHEYNNLDSFLSGLLHLQNVTDDVTFATATSAFKSAAAGMKDDQDAIDDIVGDVKVAGQIIGYLVKALAFVAKL